MTPAAAGAGEPMPIDSNLVAQAARSLREAARDAVPIAPLRTTFPHLDAAGAYAIQRLNAQHRVEHEGRRVVGCKVGLTALAVQAQLGVDQPDFGVLFDDM